MEFSYSERTLSSFWFISRSSSFSFPPPYFCFFSLSYFDFEVERFDFEVERFDFEVERLEAECFFLIYIYEKILLYISNFTKKVLISNYSFDRLSERKILDTENVRFLRGGRESIVANVRHVRSEMKE